MEQTFELVIDEATRLALGIPFDDPADQDDSCLANFDEEAWAAELQASRAEDDHVPEDADSVPPEGWALLGGDGQHDRASALDRIVRLRAQQSQLVAAEQRVLAQLAAAVREELPATADAKDREVAYRSLIAELAVTNRVSDRTMAGRLAEAETLVAGFPATLSALELGSIGMGHVRTIVEHGMVITDVAARARYEAVVLERAATVTPGRLRRFAQLAAARLGEVSFQERHVAARAKRGVVITELGDGMSQISHVLPTLLAEAVWDRLTQQAKAIAKMGDPRTYDQIRSDLAAELLLTGQCAVGEDSPHAAAVGVQAQVSVVIPVLSLLGRDTEPATIAGKGPIDMATARALAAETPELVRILTDPVSDQVLAVDTYRPSEKLRRFLRMRDGRCRFPSCNRAARRCDIDHTLDWFFGGKTRADNLECLCKNHHTLKHHGGWSVRQTSPGVLEWTSPTGQVIRDLPDTGPRLDAA